MLTFPPLSAPRTSTSFLLSHTTPFFLLLRIWIVCSTSGRTRSTEEQLDLVSEVVSLLHSSRSTACWQNNVRMCRIASFSGDLSSLTAPPFILSPVSLTEFPGMFVASLSLLLPTRPMSRDLTRSNTHVPFSLLVWIPPLIRGDSGRRDRGT